MPSESIRVLLVEDNMADAGMLYEGLEEALPGQFQMTHVKRLSEALEYLWKETCDVVLLDLGLPDSHGIDTLVLTRAQAPGVPIVVLTGFQDDSLGDQALEEGAQDYLVKGQVDSNVLARSMRYAIARKAVAEALIGEKVALAKAGVLRRSRLRLIAAHESVRRDIAAQLQDGVQEMLTVLKGRLQEFSNGTSSVSDKNRGVSNVIDELSRKIEQEVNDLSRQLYPACLSEGLIPAIQSFRDRFGAELAVAIKLDDGFVKQDHGNGNVIPEQVGLAAYRIAEEALTNAVRHAKARKVTISLDMSQVDWLRVTVQDDGEGFELQSSFGGLGLGTMRDYAEAVGGECSVKSDPTVGTAVIALLPLSPPGAEHPESSAKGHN